MVRTTFAMLCLVHSLFPLSVDLTVKESAGVQAVQYPVTVVVPLPQGQFQNTALFKLMGPGNTQVTAQLSVLTRWWYRDQSIRNLQVSFLGDAAAGGSSVYTLTDNGGAAGANPMSARDSGGVVTVMTGPLKFTVHKTANKIFDQVWLDLNSNGQFEDAEKMLTEIADQGGVLTERDSAATRLASANRGVQVSIEEMGPVRTVIKVEAPTTTVALGNYYGYKLRIYAYAGRSDVKVDFTLKNAQQGKDGRIVYFDDFSLKFKPNLTGAATLSFGGASGVHGGALGSGGGLFQATASAYQVTGSVTGSGAQAAGWMDLSDASRGVMIGVKDLWQQFPKALEASGSGDLYARLWPRGGEDGAGIYWLGDMQYKTHTVYFYFHGIGESAATLGNRMKQIQRKPAAVVPLSWYAQARMPVDLMGVVPLAAAPAVPYFGNTVSDTLGWRNFYSAGRAYTATTGGSPREWRADGYMVSGDPRWLYQAENWARHSADIRPTHIDGYQHPMEASWGNFVPGGYAWSNWRENAPVYEYGAAWDGWYPYDDQHAWQQEMEDAYYYTGDRLLYDNLLNLGEIFKSRLSGPYPASLYYPSGQANGRQLGWIFELVRNAATLSGDTGAFHMLSRMAEALTDTVLDPVYGPNVADDQAFCQAIGFQSLLHFYRELPAGYTRDKLFGALMGLGDYISVHCWAADNRGVGKKMSDRATPYFDNADIGDVPAMMYYLTGNSLYREKARIISGLGSFWTNWQGGRAGKAVSYVLNFPRTDTIPPPAIADLTAFYTTRSTDTVLLLWTTPAGAQRYDIRSSAKAIVPLMTSDQTATQENWWHCDPHPFLRSALGGGQRDQLLVAGPNVRARNFLVRSFDAAGDEANLSDFSNLIVPQCCFDPDTVVATEQGGARPAPAAQFVEAFPNPASGVVTLRITGFELRTVKCEIYDLSGRKVMHLARGGISGREIKWSTFSQPAGLYILRLEGAGKTLRRRLVLVK